jgi:hypothetical protein
MKDLKERRLKALKDTYENYFVPICIKKGIEPISFEDFHKKANELGITLA